MGYGPNVRQNRPTDAHFELQFSNRFLKFFPGYFCLADKHIFYFMKHVQPSPLQNLYAQVRVSKG